MPTRFESSTDAQRRPLSRAPLLGALFGGLLVALSIVLSANNLLAFFSLGGLIVVVGGVLAVAFMSFPVADVQAALGAIAAMLREPVCSRDGLHGDMQTLIGWARLIKTHGKRQLESGVAADEIRDPFIQYGLNMVLGGYTPDEVRDMTITAAEAEHERDCVPLDVLQAMSSHAPAFGMIGTLVGMVAMLRSLTGDVGELGATLGVAFLSTLYGVISARMVYMPAAARLRQAVESRAFQRTLVVEGLTMLASDKTPNQVQDRLNGFLRPELRDYFDSLPKVPVATAPSRTAARPAGAYRVPQLRAIGL